MRYTKEIETEILALENYGFKKVKLYDDCDEGRYYDALMDQDKIEVWVDKIVKWRYFGVKDIEEVEWFEIGTTRLIIDDLETMKDATEVGEVITAPKSETNKITLGVNDDLQDGPISLDFLNSLKIKDELPLLTDDKDVTLEFIGEISEKIKEAQEIGKKSTKTQGGRFSLLEDDQMTLFDDGDPILDLYIKK